MYNFKKYLFDAYNGYGDKRVKDIKKDYPFKIDDQNDDVHEQFCGIFVKVIDENRFVLSLTNNAPISSKIKSMIIKKGGKVEEMNRKHIEVTLDTDDYNFIEELSEEIKNLISPEKRYANKNWKWLCPRTAASLKRFAELVKNYSKDTD